MPTISPAEKESAGDTWLYLTAFQNDFVSVVDPISGHALHQVPINADQAGMAVSPDGTRLYVVDGLPAQDGQLRVFDTATWQVISQEPIPDRLRLLGGNPMSLSPDGRWLVLGFYEYDRRVRWKRVFDTETLEFLPEEKWQLGDCGLNPRLVGQPDGSQVYIQCQGFVAVLKAEDLSTLQQIPSPTPFEGGDLGWPQVGSPDLAVSPNGKRLYGLYPKIEHRAEGSYVPVVGTDLELLVWETDTGERIKDVRMSQQALVPLAMEGRGDASYLAVSRGGERVFVAWEDMLWALDGESLQVVRELRLPAPVDGMVQSVDGRELYLLPATFGNLGLRLRGMFTVDATILELVSHVDDWPRLTSPFFFAAPAATSASKLPRETLTPTASLLPISVLGSLVESALNQNTALWRLSPAATAIELQTIDWIKDIIGFPPTSEGIFVSGGQMANIVAHTVLRDFKSPWDTRRFGVRGPTPDAPRLRIYASVEAHYCHPQAAELLGLGSDAVWLVPVDERYMMRLDALRGNCSELRGSEQPAAFQEGIETSGPPGAKEGCQGHLAVGALP